MCFCGVGIAAATVLRLPPLLWLVMALVFIMLWLSLVSSVIFASVVAVDSLDTNSAQLLLKTNFLSLLLFSIKMSLRDTFNIAQSR